MFSYFFCIGIDFEQLILELRFGVRLPPPQFCPFPITLLIKECFHENPHQRPSFVSLKDSIAHMCSSLRADNQILSENDSCDSQDTVIYTDFSMKEKYLHMKKQNQNAQLVNHFQANNNCWLSTNSSSSNNLAQDPLSCYASLEKEIFHNILFCCDKFFIKENLLYVRV